MRWACRLYGHRWRHPGSFEVVLTDDDVPAFPFECADCATTMALKRKDRSWSIDRHRSARMRWLRRLGDDGSDRG